MRGRGGLRVRQWLPAGITPAYAGKSVSVIWLVSQPQDHPRVCGEEKEGAPGRVPPLGSPPRMRGREPVVIRRFRRGRITPAYAGKSNLRQSKRLPTWDHPRVCGEESFVSHPCSDMEGSPPRVRGKAVSFDPPQSFRGITPACAGKSCKASKQRPSTRDHPRVCGEKISNAQTESMQEGSPPRVRGKVAQAVPETYRYGITPACAGKSTLPLALPARRCDHPRVCGEKQAAHSTWSAAPGSPPRVRGKASFSRHHRPGDGITPACAGKSARQCPLGELV